MKILAIAGRNLASLGKFELNLEGAPFDQEGLFAITGPTGAGKSTILDAMCVALYDRIPRSPRTKAKLSPDSDNPFTNLSLADARHLMRRGAKSCFAATTFLGVDGFRYRACWEIRPRIRKAKTLNDASLSLENLATGDSLTGKKTDMLKAIQAKVGLTFDQFCRSVLLAQGDFAAFLKADSDQRAELLERMTGTEIYRDLSLAAFERGRVEVQLLQELQLQMAEHSILTSETRTELEKEFAGKDTELKLLKAAWERQTKRVVGFERTEMLQRARDIAVASHQEATKAWLALAETQRDVQRWEMLADAREAWSAKRRLTARLLTSMEKNKKLEEAVPNQAAEAERLHQTLTQSKTARASLIEQIEDQKPIIEMARKLDHQIETGAKNRDDLADRHLQIIEKLNTSDNTLNQLTQQALSWLEQLQESTAQMAQLQPYEGLALVWEQNRDALRRYAKIRTDIFNAAQELTRNHWKLTQSQAQTTRAKQMAHHGKLALASLKSAQMGVNREGLAPNRSQWMEAHQKLVEKRQALTWLSQIHQEIQQLQTASDQASLEETILAADAESRAALLAENQQILPKLSGQHAEAQRHLERLLLANSDSANAMRSHLETGKPCPVCGATEHPLQPATFNPLIEETRQRVAKFNQQIQTCQTQLAKVEHETRRDQDRRTKLAKEARLRRETQQTVLDQFTSLATALTISPETELGSERMDELIGGLNADLTEASTQLETIAQQLDHQENQLALYHQCTGIIQQRCHQLGEQVHLLENQSQEVNHALATVTAQSESLGAEVTNLVEQLRPIMCSQTHWEMALFKTPDAYLAELDAKIAAFHQATAEKEAATEGQHQVAPLLAGAREAAKLISSQAQTIKEQLDAATQTFLELLQQRQSLLEGRSVAKVEATQRQSQATLETSVQNQSQALEVARKRLAEQQTLVTHQRALTAEIHQELGQIQTRVEDETKRFGLSLDQVTPLLDQDPAEIAKKRQRLDEAKAQLHQTEGAKQGVESQLETHLKNFMDEGSLEEATNQRETIQNQKDRVEALFADLRIQLKTDDVAKQRLGELQKTYNQQAVKTQLWQTMHDLIGSHDGKKFRIYAQSLTLEMMLHHANHHLADLARRYRLERLPGPELALRIIDRDMGDEIRSINSLSGGETFLVSLALALGLATFTTAQTPIESLFIDEGFGSLDSESLEIALDTLEALQAQGRQVGVISHVQTLVERIAIQVQVRKTGSGLSRVQLHFSS